MCSTAFGRGSTPFFSPATSRTPRGRPMTVAKKVESTVTYSVSQIAVGSRGSAAVRSATDAAENRLSYIFIYLLCLNIGVGSDDLDGPLHLTAGNAQQHAAVYIIRQLLRIG